MGFSDLNLNQCIRYHQYKYRHKFYLKPFKYEKPGSYGVKCSDCGKLIYQWSR